MENKQNKQWTMQEIGFVRSDFKEKFGIPRQSGRAPSLKAEIYLDKSIPISACKELENFSHIWVIFAFSQTAEQAEKKAWSVRWCTSARICLLLSWERTDFGYSDLSIISAGWSHSADFYLMLHRKLIKKVSLCWKIT